MRCPHCESEIGTKVVDTTHDSRGGVRRRRECKNCNQRFSTYERPVLAIPFVVKADGTREEFSREKLLRGLRLAVVKRPVSAAKVDRLVGKIESKLQAIGKAEVPSRMIGDMIMEGLKDLDQVAYIRFALVYLGLEDIQSIRQELDRLKDN